MTKNHNEDDGDGDVGDYRWCSLIYHSDRMAVPDLNKQLTCQFAVAASRTNVYGFLFLASLFA